ncbi:hypothetical protein F3N42_10715 [Marinihelvus fidelis]|uniref:Blue (type 1) copper domain-containing protein n=1 Tax=Marinihelvus fidelis TaxID=2613842 RepID=A0A5N0T7G4_9GAMM|nr:plastocyanin/azurin family copper-binding protein [Marinihelvus fidelis]KAA9130832.1 hypothetical protein F3N42_10715 [Marinihelvus fidelis]
MKPYRHDVLAKIILAIGLAMVSRQAVAEVHIVEVGDNFFSPAQLTIQAGDTVRWVNAAGGMAHDVESDTGLFSSGAAASQFTFEFTFDDPGSYPYFCSVHGGPGGVGMSGAVVVEAAPEPPPFQVNPGLNDAWYDPLTAGQGFLFAVYTDIEMMFLAWFTHDTVAPGEDASAVIGDPGHRWLTALGGWEDNVVTLDVALTGNGLFNTLADEQETTEGYGTVVIEFHDCNTASLEYTFPSIPLQGTIALERIIKTGDNVALCEAYQSMEPET